jgi:hypothetical protein
MHARALSEDYSDAISTIENLYDELDWNYLERRAKALGTLRKEWRGIDSLIKHYRVQVSWKMKR